MKMCCPQCGLITKRAAYDHGQAVCPRCGAPMVRGVRIIRKGGDPKMKEWDRGSVC